MSIDATTAAALPAVFTPHELPGLAYAFALTLARVGCAILLLPGFGEAEIPAMMRAGLALAVTAAILPGVGPLMPPLPAALPLLASQVAAEVATGLFFGWIARLTVQSLPIAGQLIATMTGLASVLQPDPSMGPQTTAFGRIFALAAPALVLASGLYAMPLAALAGSFAVIRPGTLLASGDVAQTVAAATQAAFALGLRLAAPFVLAGLAWQVGLALLARLVPRLQIYFAGLPGQVLGGLALLGLLIGGLLAAFGAAVQGAWSALPGAG